MDACVCMRYWVCVQMWLKDKLDETNKVNI